MRPKARAGLDTWPKEGGPRIAVDAGMIPVALGLTLPSATSAP
ncbi:MAG: hypothetical protein ACHQ4J_01890 [Candidatus Binatia bacterium]